MFYTNHKTENAATRCCSLFKPEKKHFGMLQGRNQFQRFQLGTKMNPLGSRQSQKWVLQDSKGLQQFCKGVQIKDFSLLLSQNGFLQKHFRLLQSYFGLLIFHFRPLQRYFRPLQTRFGLLQLDYALLIFSRGVQMFYFRLLQFGKGVQIFHFGLLQIDFGDRMFLQGLHLEPVSLQFTPLADRRISATLPTLWMQDLPLTPSTLNNFKTNL